MSASIQIYPNRIINLDGLTLHFIIIQPSDLMLTSILRIGPFAIAQFIFIGIAVGLWLAGQAPSCYYYTNIFLALATFLIEMIVSFRLIKNNNKLRQKYMSQRIKWSHSKFYCRLVWDNINVLLVIMLLYYSLVADGILLTSVSSQLKSNMGSEQPQQCFILFSLCLFAELQGNNSFKPEDTMMMWMLYAATTFIISILCIVFSKEYYQYCSNVTQNRRLALQFGDLNATLLDCNIYSINSQTIINQEEIEQIGQCSICLHSLVDKNRSVGNSSVIKLKCDHLFHRECIEKWLKIKDHCPFRCSLTV